MGENKAFVIGLPIDILKRCRELDAVRKFLDAEKRRILGYVDNLELAGSVIDREIKALLDEFSGTAIKQLGFDPQGVDYTYSLERGELIVVIPEGGEDEGNEDA